MGLGRGKAVLGQINLQRAACADAGDHADGAAAVGRDAQFGVGRREFGVLRGDTEVSHEGKREAGAGGRAMHARHHDLRHSPQRGDEGVIMLQQLADHGCDGAGRCRGPEGLKVAAGGERAAIAFDDQHPDFV